MRKKYLKTDFGYKRKSDLVQLRNPMTHSYTVIHKPTARIVSHRRLKEKPYKDIRIV